MTHARFPHLPVPTVKLIEAAEKAVKVWLDNKDDITDYDASMKGLQGALNAFGVEPEKKKGLRPDPRNVQPI